MIMPTTRSSWTHNIGPFQITARENFSNSQLPTKKEILERMVWFMTPRRKDSLFGKPKSKEWAASEIASDLTEHWIWCNIYPKHAISVKKSVLVLYDEFGRLKRYPRKTEEWIRNKIEPYIKSLSEVMDIRTTDISYRKRQE